MEKCEWPHDDELMMKYHDEEWGVPLFDDKKIFEFMVLDGFQAGLSWRTVLYKRENFRRAFEDYDLYKILRFDSKKIEALLNDKSIIRNKLKVNAVISNAQAFLKVQEEFGSFSKYMWQFVDNKPIVNKWKTMTEIPASTRESDIMSKDLKKRGFKFVGTTICYAFMQAAGMVNDHIVNCFRHNELIKFSETLTDNG